MPDLSSTVQTPPRRAALLKRLVLASFTAGFVALVLELGLRLVGFSAPLQPIVIAGSDAGAKVDAGGFVADPVLGHRLEPGGMFRGRRVNEDGFLGRSAARDPATNLVRVLCLGDSCTAQGLPPYSDLLHDLLQTNTPTAAPWEAFNMAVHGYSSAQGLRLFERHASTARANFVTIYFGWNDHWLAPRADRFALARSTGPTTAALLRILHRSRLYQLAASGARRAPAATATNLVLRVAPEDYRANLVELVRAVRATGATPILLTAPRAAALTPLLVKNRQTTSLADAARLHDEYCEITRAVAAQSGAALLDLERKLSGEEARRLFSGDGIHFQDEGRVRIAGEIHGLLAELSGGG